jgi:peroxiredoxin 2/4
MIKVGSPAPDFKLEGYFDGKFKEYALKDYKNKWVVLFFYPLDFTFVCPTEIRGFSEHYAAFKKAGAEVFGISVDSKDSHRAWVEGDLGEINFPLLSDFHRRMAEDYEVLHEEDGTARRGTFIIDPKGNVRYIIISDDDVGRSVDETLRVVHAFQTGKLCAAEWKPGDKHLVKT